jgi:glutathione S-transferase
MKLFYGSVSPYVRKVMVTAIEIGLDDRLQLEKFGLLSPARLEPRLAAVNPLAKIPALLPDEGPALFDSRVICEYLDSLHDGEKLFPAVGPKRWHALTQMSAADGLLDAGMTARAEMARPPAVQAADWIAGHMGKARRVLDLWEHEVEQAGVPAGLSGAARIDIGDIAWGCALGWLDFRMPDESWRNTHPALARWFSELSQRRSMSITMPAQPDV